MSDTKAFATADVLSAVTGYIVSERKIAAVYDVLNFMSGESLMTHQLPRVGREAKEFMRSRIPGFEQIERESEAITGENWKEFAARWVARLGPTIDVPRMGLSAHERIDPMSELVEYAHPSKIIVVEPRS